MQIDNRTVSPGSGDGLGTLAGRNAAAVSPSAREDVVAATALIGGYDPSSRVSLSAETLLFLSRTKRAPEKYPALTKDEWSNQLSPQLAAREYQAFGKYSETGDYKAYYRAFMDYYDNLRPDDQNSLRYFGTRDAAMAGLRSAEYAGQSGGETDTGFQTLVSVALASDTTTDDIGRETSGDVAGMTTGDMFGWDTGTISYETATPERNAVSGIEKLYLDSF